MAGRCARPERRLGPGTGRVWRTWRPALQRYGRCRVRRGDRGHGVDEGARGPSKKSAALIGPGKDRQGAGKPESDGGGRSGLVRGRLVTRRAPPRAVLRRLAVLGPPVTHAWPGTGDPA
ncbi:hypothetical protein NDU88_009451 [Pleurodeles waltl]|uniref:Uncharacterized protein n=1 Tax=Pleurodeles waltl TaxID=8319 RepID=A0AAV7S0E7_PLEWA|nr:hypothetical protein NDU88_009451 [Pleurodeles waltl]